MSQPSTHPIFIPSIIVVVIDALVVCRRLLDLIFIFGLSWYYAVSDCEKEEEEEEKEEKKEDLRRHILLLSTCRWGEGQGRQESSRERSKSSGITEPRNHHVPRSIVD